MSRNRRAVLTNSYSDTQGSACCTVIYNSYSNGPTAGRSDGRDVHFISPSKRFITVPPLLMKKLPIAAGRKAHDETGTGGESARAGRKKGRSPAGAISPPRATDRPTER